MQLGTMEYDSSKEGIVSFKLILEWAGWECSIKEPSDKIRFHVWIKAKGSALKKKGKNKRVQSPVQDRMVLGMNFNK